MEPDLLDLYGRASEWTGIKVRGAASKLDAPTTCDKWNVRTLMNHMLETQRYFVGSARGEDVALSQNPPDLLSHDPSSDFDQARDETISNLLETWSNRKDGACARDRLQRPAPPRLGPRSVHRAKRNDARWSPRGCLWNDPRPLH